ncbi:MAG TPA: alpha/beta hydrolase, partial [Dermatophilaceae bacterium]|nr:alpha/beta hydrolase [Dermatophilaceae bacterium]
PQGYDTFTLASDAASMVRALGEVDAVVVGQGSGAWTAWAMPAMQPAVTRGVAALAMPHPLVLRRASFTDLAQARASAYILGLQRPFVPERQMGRQSRYVERLLRAFASPSSPFPSAEEVQRYTAAMALPFVAHSAAEHYRWVGRSQLRLDGRRFNRRLRSRIAVPVLHLHGADDGAVLPGTATGSDRYAAGSFEERLLPGVGHFVAEEAPDEVNRLLVQWLSSLA